jgi:hypothetical protein
MIVRKAVKMADTMGVPVLGLVENMTHVVCPDCGAHIELFGRRQGGSIDGLPLLASIAVDPTLSALCDSGALESYEPDPFDHLVDTIRVKIHGQEANRV